MDSKKVTVNTQELGKWLEEKKKVTVLDIRPKEQRDEWYIPGSVHLDAYEKLKANDPSILDEISPQVFLPSVCVPEWSLPPGTSHPEKA